jgi:hypothetical protein
MAEIVLVIGATGSGKSYGVKYLNPKETVVINLNESKRLPWGGSSKIYNKENTNFFNVSTSQEIIALLDGVDKKATHVKNVVIDDMRYLMEKEYLAKALESGYAKYTMIGKHFQEVVDKASVLRSDLVVFMMLHDEDVINDKVIVAKKIKTVGSLVDNHFNPLELVNIALFCINEHGKDGNVHKFFTQETILNGVLLPAKTPEGLFADITIPNDLQLVVDAINNYY